MVRSKLIPVLILCGVALAGCNGTIITPDQQETAPMIGPAPRLNQTPMASALACMNHVRGRGDLRVGVSDLVDGTGVMEGLSQNSKALSQRPDMMMVVALAAAGASLVNRSSVNVAEWELNKAMEKKLGDGRSATIENERVNYRPVKAGTLLGSTHYVTGAITELNWNIASGVAEGGAYSAAIGKRTYRIGIAVDIVVTNTQTTQIVHAKSYKKQLVGMETTANFFRFFARDSILGQIAQGNGTSQAVVNALELFNANLGEKQNEPTQTALRWVIELAAYDVMRSLRKSGAQCDQYLPPDSLEGAPNPALLAANSAPPPSYSAPISVRAEAPKPEPTMVAAAPAPAPPPVNETSAAAPTAVAYEARASVEGVAAGAAAEAYSPAPPPPPAQAQKRRARAADAAMSSEAAPPKSAPAAKSASSAKMTPVANTSQVAASAEPAAETASSRVFERAPEPPVPAPVSAAQVSSAPRLIAGAAPPLGAELSR